MTNRKPRLGSIYQRKKKGSDGSIATLPTYWIRYCKNGRLYRESAKTKNYGEAERQLKRRQGELVTGRFAGLEPERVLVGDLLDDVLDDLKANGRKSLPSVEGGIRLHLRPAMAHIKAAAFGTSILKKYIAGRKTEQASNATINREMTILKRAFNLAYRAEPPLVLRVPHIPRLEENNIRTGFLEKEGYKGLRDLLPEYLRLLFVLGYHTGARLGELRALQWSQVEHDRIVLHPGTTKNKEGRWLPIYSDMGEWIDRARNERAAFPECQFLCHRNGRPLGDSCVKKAWKAACNAAELPDLRFHDLRRTAVRNMDRAGVSRPIAMRISGHKRLNPCTTATTLYRSGILLRLSARWRIEDFLADTLSSTLARKHRVPKSAKKR
jgi:integrase